MTSAQHQIDRIHIVGCHRSGTTLMFEMMVACFEHAGRCQHEKTIFNPIEPVAGLYIGKKPSDITHMKHLFECDERLAVIYMRRDPRSVVTSVHASKADVYFSSFERWSRYEAAAQALINHPRFLVIRYEDLVANPDAVQTSIQTRLPFLTRRHPFSTYEHVAQTSTVAEVSLGGVRPVDVDRIHAWKEHLPRIAFQMQKYPQMASRLISAGYEADNRWQSCLDGIEPLVQQYGEVPAPLWKRYETNLRYYFKTRTYLAERLTGKER